MQNKEFKDIFNKILKNDEDYQLFIQTQNIGTDVSSGYTDLAFYELLKENLPKEQNNPYKFIELSTNEDLHLYFVKEIVGRTALGSKNDIENNNNEAKNKFLNTLLDSVFNNDIITYEEKNELSENIKKQQQSISDWLTKKCNSVKDILFKSPKRKMK